MINWKVNMEFVTDDTLYAMSEYLLDMYVRKPKKVKSYNEYKQMKYPTKKKKGTI